MEISQVKNFFRGLDIAALFHKWRRLVCELGSGEYQLGNGYSLLVIFHV